MTNQTPAAGGDLRLALVEAAIPLEALLIAGVGHMSPEMQEGIRNGVQAIRSALAAPAAPETLSASDAACRQLFDDLFCGRNFQVSIGGNPILVERMLDRIDELQHALQEPKP